MYKETTFYMNFMEGADYNTNKAVTIYTSVVFYSTVSCGDVSAGLAAAGTADTGGWLGG